MWDLIFQLGGVLFLLALGYFEGRRQESRHLASIRKREKQTGSLPVISVARGVEPSSIEETFLVTGGVVIANDYFKRFLAFLRSLVGGRVAAYESLIDRARREAILRMKEQAAGCDLVLNLRVDTSSIGTQSRGRQIAGSIEVLASGTAVRLRHPAQAQ